MGITQFTIANSKFKLRLVGEAKFLRALFYFRLLQTYGGVPIINETPDINSPIETLLRRASKNEVFEFIENDLIESINVLPEKSTYADNQLGRATIGAAKTLLAKVRFNTIRKIIREIINPINT